MNSQETNKSSLKPKTFNWLITGGCGFIGTSLIKKLVEEGGHNIRILDNLSVGTEKDLSKICNYSVINLHEIPLSFSNSSNIQLVIGDIKDPQTCILSSQDIDVIVHLAANTGVGPSVENPRLDMEANVIGTFNMLEAARQNKVKRFIFASSGAPVGECTPPIHEELAPHPVSPYGASKLAGEGYCSAYFRTFGIETVALRFGNVYGPGSGHKNSVVAKFIRNAINGETLEIYGDGRQTRDFIYIDDLISAVMLSATVSGIGGESFQIATNAETTVGELTKKLVNIMKQNGVNNISIIYGEQRQGDVKRNYSDTSKAFRMLGWTSKCNLEDGLLKTFLYFYLSN